MDRRVDRIERVLQQLGGRARLQDVLEKLREEEEYEDLPYQSVYIAIQEENERLLELGERPKFVTSRDGEARGFVRLREGSEFEAGSEASRLEQEILRRNEHVDEEIGAWLQRMDWRTFESTFLTRVLEALGFQEVQITQATRDGGVDARVSYKRGLVQANAIISAKRWKSKVSVDEVQKLRGIRGEEDTAIIITTAQFTADAQAEAKPGQNQRVVYLIDGKQLIDVCKRNQIGVRKVQLPELLVVDPESRTPNGEKAPDMAPEAVDEDSGRAVRRLHDSMLSGELGLTYDEVAELSGYALNTVKAYLYDEERRRALGDAIRADPKRAPEHFQSCRSAAGGKRLMAQTIYLDECGYTGDDLIDVEQPTFAIATHSFSEEESAGLKQRFFGSVQAPELKHSSLQRTARNQRAIVDFLHFAAQEVGRVRVMVADKRFALTAKLVDFIVEPPMHRHGLNLYEQGGHAAFSNLVFAVLQVEGASVLDQLLKRFQDMIRTRTNEAVGEFAKFLAVRHETSVVEEVLDMIRSSFAQLEPDDITTLPARALDLSFTMALSAIYVWRQAGCTDRTWCTTNLRTWRGRRPSGMASFRRRHRPHGLDTVRRKGRFSFPWAFVRPHSKVRARARPCSSQTFLQALSLAGRAGLFAEPAPVTPTERPSTRCSRPTVTPS